jgi:DNA-binding PadR family transcriptional regulator
MESVVLGLLIIRSLTLYELNQAFKQGISMFYSASYGSLQIAVKNLLIKGMITYKEEVEKGRHKKVYSITAGGREAFYHWMLDEIPVNKLEVTALAKVYFLGLIDSIEQRQRIIGEIVSKIELVQGQLDSMNAEIGKLEIPASYRDILNFQQKTLDYGIQSHAFAREWFLALLEGMQDE